MAVDVVLALERGSLAGLRERPQFLAVFQYARGFQLEAADLSRGIKPAELQRQSGKLLPCSEQ